ncbi:TetR/AcrR family transcriptional regulator [Aliiruegeria sabulilitoris]|uniref:TetR/AcrR family transcriptional regulator n=1 Tax=Aliiruegeria sabulilitoris TaxID=1510458 RepID=UPI00082AB853|nr:TetR/AcrR family transcriptional regulator [Aliiruegeria sabulilitoris]NDR58749.1 TetR/AcrR family transcriptional regulator [Pseudoruegeria sp. M32A2M]
MGKQPYHHRNLANALVERAIVKLDAPGDGNLSLRAIAKDVGVTAMAPYNHFDGKEDFLDAVAAEGFRMLSRDIEAVQGISETLEDVIAAHITTYFEFSRRHPGLFRLLFETGVRDAGSRARKVSRTMFDGLCRALTGASGGMNTDDATSLANLVFAAGHGITVLSDRNLFRSVEEGADSVEQMISRASRALAAEWQAPSRQEPQTERSSE